MLKIVLFCFVALSYFLIAAADSDIPVNLSVTESSSEVITVEQQEGKSTAKADDIEELERSDVKCSAPPEIDGIISPILQNGEHPVGTIVTYQCQFGLVSRSSSSHFSVCRINESSGKAEWTSPNITCVPRSCGDPGYVANGRRIGNLFTFPHKVEFECVEGYELHGLKDRYCQAGGEWSGKLPVCEPIYCPVPRDPINGLVSYSSLEYGTELYYECYKGYMLINRQPRICGDDGRWSNDEPECIETRCKIPEAPEHGSVHLSNEPKVDSLAIFSCNEGRTLIGASTSKCLSSGDWTFDPPKCLRTCTVHAIQDGELGRYEVRYDSFRRREVFVAFQVGEHVKHYETVAVRCKDGFILVNHTTSKSDDILCNDGKWSRALQCQGTMCTGEPPPMKNGRPMVSKRLHGNSIWYRCDDGFDKTKHGNVTCIYGTWKGLTPVCSDLRCYMHQLDYPGLIKPENTFMYNKGYFEINCEEGYKKLTSQIKIFCYKGKWDILNNPCAIETCEEDPPALYNGRPIEFTRMHGSAVDYECDEDFDVVGHSSVQCKFGNWGGEPPICKRSLKSLKTTLTSNFEATNINGQSFYTSQCFCTFDYRRDLLTARVGDKELESDHRVERGEKVVFACLYPNTFIVWPNGLRLNRSVELTCHTCQNWNLQDLPWCETRTEGDSFINYTSKVQLLPGGIIEVPKLGSITLRCVNSWLQPTWYTATSRGIRSFRDVPGTERSTGVFRSYIVIDKLDQEHAGRYQCLANNFYGPDYRVTYVDLRVAELVQCPELSTETSKGSFNIIYENERKVNSVARYSCKDSSKHIVGVKDRKCQENGRWSNSFPECSDIQCPLLDEKSIFLINYSNNRKVNTVAFYYCKDNKQRVIGYSNRTCLHTGEWSGSNPVCEDISCSTFPTYNGLSITYSDGTKVNSIATFGCLYGRTLVGSTSARCRYNGTWSHTKPSCEMLEIRCPKLEGKGIFSIKYTNDRKINSTAQFYCKAADQKVEGCNFMTCQPNGEWTGDYPTCVDYVTCEKFSSTPNLNISYTRGLSVGSVASFHCSPPTSLVGTSFATCGTDGSWSNVLPACKGPDCSIDTLMSTIPEGMFPDMEDVTSEFVISGSGLRLNCEDDLILIGNSVATCNIDGKWEYENAQCVPGCRLSKDGSSLLIVEPVKDYYRFGEFVLLSCPPGQKLTTEVERVMCLGKTWSDLTPNCVEYKETSPSEFGVTTKEVDELFNSDYYVS